MNDDAIVCTNLYKTFKAGFIPKPVEALKNVSFSIPQGTVTGFLGPNGSGKSTFIKIATDFISATSGGVKFFGNQPFSEVKSLVGFVPEKPSYSNSFTGFEILKLHAGLTKENRSRIDEVVELVGLGDAVDRAFGTYSKGMRQRLAIAQALLPDPKLLILDEPLSGLDPDGREILIQVIMGYAKKPGKTVVLSSHLLEDLQRICNNLIVINRGELLFSGDPTSVFNPDKFSVKYKIDGLTKEASIEASELNDQLSKLIDEGVSLHSVEPDSKAISSLYFDLTRKHESKKMNQRADYE